MLVLGIRYLAGCVAASNRAAAEGEERERVEWPPHPGRVFMALAAAHFQTGGDPSERAALAWLERAGPPAIRAPEAMERAVVTQYVPVNDSAGPAKAMIQSAPALTRDRQPRRFARAFLEEDTVYLIWPEADPPESVRAALAALCGKVTRIGHSSSLVQMWVANDSEAGEPNWVPDEQRAEQYLRVVGPGTLEDLQRRYNQDAVERFGQLSVEVEEAADPKVRRHAKKLLREEFGNEPPPQLRPALSLYQGYARPEPPSDGAAAVGSVFSPHLTVLALEYESGRHFQLGLVSVLQVIQRWREALVSQSNDLGAEARQLLSGHDEQGTPLQRPHLALVPLAFVGHEHADGHLLGLGIAWPSTVKAEERREVLRAVGRVERLVLGGLGTWRLTHDFRAGPPWTLRWETWTAHPKGATHWGTVTPVAFDRHPKAKSRAEYQGEVAAMIAEGCERIGLPRPGEVIVTAVSSHLGVPPAHVFPRLRRKDGGERQHVHAILLFEQPVRGPVLIGAGRYRGYGVCRPLR